MVHQVGSLSTHQELQLFIIHIPSLFADHSRAFVEAEKLNFSDNTLRTKRMKVDARTADTVPYDAVALNEWKLVASACYLTYPHQDAGGFGTWIELEDRIKIWVFLKPKPGVQGASEALNTLTNLLATDYILHMENLKQWVNISVLILTPGMVL